MLLEFSLKPVYLTMVGKKIQIFGACITRICIESRHFYPCPHSQVKTLPQILSEI